MKRLATGFAALVLSATPTAAADEPPVTWQPTLVSPQPSAVATKDSALLAKCGTPDAALLRVAQENVRRQTSGQSALPADALVFHLRAAGAPYLWPRAWSITGANLDEADLESRLGAWVSRSTTLGERRCAVARGVASDGDAVVSAVSVDVLADVNPLPTSARVGQWLTLTGTMHVPASEVKVVLLGPRGAPRKVLASLSNGRIRSSFSVDQPGKWLVQVLAHVANGPRPVLQANVWAGVKPSAQFVRSSAPGEDAADDAQDDREAMLSMINAARREEGMPPLAHNPALERVAMEHAEAMLEKRLVAHDVGDGSPLTRVNAAGIHVRVAGENVASAATLADAHRAVWSSPSHRGNLLDTRFSSLGVAVVRDAKNRVWVAQLFGG